MKVNEILTESLSRVVFHYTNILSALKILESGNFELSSALGSIETQSMPKGYYYFLSTTRTSQGGYHDFVGSSGVLFKLDGSWYNQHYRSSPHDYWNNRDPSMLHHRKHEAEDRLFSREPAISIDGVTEIHVLVKPDAEKRHKMWARRVLIAAKKRDIKTFLYNDVTDWRNLDRRHLVDPAWLKGIDEPKGYSPPRRPGYFSPWLELIFTDNKSLLSRKADQIAYGLQYTYDRSDITKGLSNDFSNARKPDSDSFGRKQVVEIVKFMRANNFTTVEELVNFLADKWKSIR